jgi:uncharacterized protein
MGRGRHYGRLRRSAEAVQGSVYGAGWAARVAYSLGLQGSLHLDHRNFDFGEALGRTPLRVAFVSDLHAGPLTDPRLLATAIRLKPSLGMFGVFGNHDLWQDDVAISQTLADAGVRLLVNEEHRLPEPHAHVVLYGMDEPGTGNPLGPSTPLADRDVRIVLMHSPLGLRYLESAPFHVAFCGHTHGGQVALPSGAPIVLPRGSGDRRHAGGGLFSVSGGQLLVSRGLGMSDLPVRVFAPSEIHICTFA